MKYKDKDTIDGLKSKLRFPAFKLTGFAICNLSLEMKVEKLQNKINVLN